MPKRLVFILMIFLLLLSGCQAARSEQSSLAADGRTG